MYILGLTGSIGTGKSAIAGMFRRLRCPVFSADTIVDKLYSHDVVQKKITSLLPQEFGPITRLKVARYAIEHAEIIEKLEEIFHPEVEKILSQEIDQAHKYDSSLMVLEIPLMYEVGWQDKCDGVMMMICDPKIQVQRLMSRPGMTVEKLKLLQARQWPEAKKRAAANFVVDSTQGFVHTFGQIKTLLRQHCFKEK